MKKLLRKVIAYCLCMTILLGNGNFVFAKENERNQVVAQEEIVTPEDGTAPEEVVTPEDGTAPEEKNVLMIGNSFTKMSDYSVGTILKEISVANNKKTKVTTITNGGAYLSYYAFWTNEYKGYYEKVLNALKSNQYDYIILQEQTKAAIENYENGMLPAVRQLCKFIQAYQTNAEVLIYETAPYVNGTTTSVEGEKKLLTLQEFQERALYGYARLQKDTGIGRIPAGAHTYYSTQIYPELNLVSDDLRHPNFAGYYMVAASIYYKIYNESPVVKAENLKKCDIDDNQLALLNGLLRENITLNQTELTMVVAESQNLTAEIVVDDSRKGTIFWKSLNPKIAEVDESTGQVTAVAEGTTIVLAETATGLMKECFITVKNTESPQMCFGQSSYKVSAGDVLCLLPKIQNWQSDDRLKWSSSNSDVASISANGTVMTKKMGKTVIKVKSSKDENLSASYILYVIGKSPVNLQANVTKITTTGGTVELSWNPVYGAKKYQIYRCDESTGSYKVVGTATDSKYVDSTVGVNIQYSYKVTAMAASALTESARSKEANIMLVGAVKNQIAVKKNRIKLTWNKNEAATGYEIYRSEKKNGVYKKIKTITKNETLYYNDRKAEKGRTYYYKIRAYKKNDLETLYSVYSQVVKGAILEAIVMEKVVVKPKSLKIIWHRNTKATGYEIYRSEKKNSGYVKLTTITKNKKTYYYDQTAEEGKNYYYKIRAYKKGSGQKIYSEYSNVLKGKIKKQK